MKQIDSGGRGKSPKEGKEKTGKRKCTHSYNLTIHNLNKLHISLIAQNCVQFKFEQPTV